MEAQQVLAAPDFLTNPENAGLIQYLHQKVGQGQKFD